MRREEIWKIRRLEIDKVEGREDKEDDGEGKRNE